MPPILFKGFFMFLFFATTTTSVTTPSFNHWSGEWLFFCFFIPNPSQVKPVNFLFSLNIFEECYHIDGIISDFSFDLYIIFCLYTGRKYLQITFFQGKNSWIFTLFQGKNSHYFTLFQDSTRLWQRIPRAEGNAPKGHEEHMALGYALAGPSARSLNACQLQVNTCEYWIRIDTWLTRWMLCLMKNTFLVSLKPCISSLKKSFWK